MSYTYSHLTTPQNVQPGLSDYILIAPMSWLDVANDPANLTDDVYGITIDDDIVFAPYNNYGFLKLLCSPFKNKLSSEPVGEVGARAFKFTLNASVPGSYQGLHATMGLLVNEPLLVLFKDSSCKAGFYYQLGTADLPAILSPEFASGDARSGAKGYNLTVSSLYTCQLLHKNENPLIFKGSHIEFSEEFSEEFY